MAGTRLRGSPRRVLAALSATPGGTATPLRKPPTGGARLDDRRRHVTADVHRALGESAASGFEISDHCADLRRPVDGLGSVHRSQERALPGLPLSHLFW